MFLSDCAKEVIVVDNNSLTQELEEHQKRYPYLKVIRLQNNVGYGQANNIGVENASGRTILLLNSDTELIDSSLCDAIRAFQNKPAKTLWGLKILWPDKSFQNSFSREISFSAFVLNYTPLTQFFRRTKAVMQHKYDGLPLPRVEEVDIVYGTAMLLNREDFLQLNGFSSDFFMYFEDIDFCDRFKKELGGKIYFYPDTAIVHHVQGSSKKQLINWLYLKSKYIYGSHKFGFWRMSIILFIDMTLLTMLYVYKNLFYNRRGPQ